MSAWELSTKERHQEKSFTLAIAPSKSYTRPTDALERAFKASDGRTTFERMCDSFKQTFLPSKDDEQQNFVEKHKVKLSAALNKYRQLRIECIDSETEANNAPVDLDRQLPSAKLALYQHRVAKSAEPPWAALIPKKSADDQSDSDGNDADSTAGDDEQVFPRMLKYLSFIGAPFMFPSPFQEGQDDAEADNASIPGEVFDNPDFPDAFAVLRTFPPINVRPQAMPARRSHEETVKEGDNPGKCPICLVEMEPGCTIIYLGCEHCYHKECIARWLEEKSTCPVCRESATMTT